MSRKPLRIAIVMEGGVVTAAVTDSLEALPPIELAVVEYDPDGFEHYAPSDVTHITQPDGRKAKAVISHPWIEPARIDLDEVFGHHTAESRVQ